MGSKITSSTWKHLAITSSRDVTRAFFCAFRKIKRRRSKDFVQIFKGNPSEFKVKLVFLLDRKTLKLYYLFNSCLNVEGTFLIAYLDCKSVTGLVVYTRA